MEYVIITTLEGLFFTFVFAYTTVYGLKASSGASLHEKLRLQRQKTSKKQ